MDRRSRAPTDAVSGTEHNRKEAGMASSTPWTSEERSEGSNLAEVLTRLDQRLARIERTLEPLQNIAEQLPGGVATVVDTFDTWGREQGNLDARVREGLRLMQRLSEPETLATAHKLLDAIASAPGLLATAGDVFDGLMRDAEARGTSVGTLVEDLRELVLDVLRTAPQVRAVFTSGILDPRALEALGSVATHVARAAHAPPAKVGLFGAIGALSDPDVQRALGFLFAVARGFGRSTAALPASHDNPGEPR